MSVCFKRISEIVDVNTFLLYRMLTTMAHGGSVIVYAEITVRTKFSTEYSTGCWYCPIVLGLLASLCGRPVAAMGSVIQCEACMVLCNQNMLVTTLRQCVHRRSFIPSVTAVGDETNMLTRCMCYLMSLAVC